MRSKSSTSRLVTTILTGCLHKKVPPTLTRISSRHRAPSPLTTIIFNRQPPHKLTMRSKRAFTGLVRQSLKLAKPKGTTRRPKQTTGLMGLMKLVQTRNFLQSTTRKRKGRPGQEGETSLIRRVQCPRPSSSSSSPLLSSEDIDSEIESEPSNYVPSKLDGALSFRTSTSSPPSSG